MSEDHYTLLAGHDGQAIEEAKRMTAKQVLENMTQKDWEIVGLKATVAQQAQMIEHLRGGPTPGFTAVDMTTAAAQGFRDGAAIRKPLLDECRAYLQCVIDKSMSRNNAEAMADELLEKIMAASKED
jgi:hypothetical protein